MRELKVQGISYMENIPESEIDEWLNKADTSDLIIQSDLKTEERHKLFTCAGVIHRLSKDGKNIEFAIVNYLCDFTGKMQNKFSGGGSELGEKPIDVVKREISEELEIPADIIEGLDFQILRNSGVYKMSYGSVSNVLLFFLAKNPLNDFEFPPFLGIKDKAIRGREWVGLNKFTQKSGLGLYSGYRGALKEAKKELFNIREEYAWILKDS